MDQALRPLLDYMVARHAATDARRAGQGRPWSADPIIASNFFCSVVRDDDRTSVEARALVTSLREDERAAAARCFRLFNHVPTLEALLPVIVRGTEADIAEVLGQLPKVYNGTAYRVNTPQGLWNLHGLAQMIVSCRATPAPEPRAQRTWRTLRSASGPFIAYQILQDMRWLHGPYTDEDTWCLVGIGAWRGYQRLRGDYDAKHWMKRKNDVAPVDRSSDVPPRMRRLLDEALVEARALLGPHINMFEVEHNLCEWDKYERIRTGEGRGRTFKPRPQLLFADEDRVVSGREVRPHDRMEQPAMRPYPEAAARGLALVISDALDVIANLCEHEGAEGFSVSTNDMLNEFYPRMERAFAVWFWQQEIR